MTNLGYVFLLTGEIDEAGTRILKELGEVRVTKSIAEEDLVHEIATVDALIVRPPSVITRKIIEHARKLKVIGRHGVGYDNIDVEAATEKRIPVTYTPGANAISVAEHAVGFMFALAKRLVLMNNATRKGEWIARDRFEGIELNGKTCGLVGLGRVGTEVARLLKTIGMQVLYFDVIRKEEVEKQFGIEWIPLSEKDKKKGVKVPEMLLKKVDFLSIHAPLTKETQGMIGAKELETMKKGAFIINTARGGIVNENALYDAIKNGRVCGAASDVFEEEPLSTQNPLLELDNVIVTPHSAALTKESKQRMARTVAEDVVRVLRNERPIYMVNPEVFE